jgi:ATP-dependent RNA helicase DDX55/SPB4
MSRLFQDIRPALHASTLATLSRLKFERATPVQSAAIPLFLKHKDVAVEACTGSGKTLAFVVPIIEILLRRERALKPGEVGAVIISPTRELAIQIRDVVKTFCERETGPECLLLIGGTNTEQDLAEIQAARNINIIVATPGRLHDCIHRAGDAISFKELEVLVLDEADRLLDMGFRKKLDSIVQKLPKQRRTGLFSATQTKEVRALIRAGMRNPAIISVKVKAKAIGGGAGGGGGGAGGAGGALTAAVPSSSTTTATPVRLSNFYVCCESNEKLGALLLFVKRHPESKIVVFFATCAGVDFYTKILAEMLGKGENGEFGGAKGTGKKEAVGTEQFPVVALHGKMVSKRRNATFDRFRSMPKGMLACTDVAARGIDIPDIDWIVQ